MSRRNYSDNYYFYTGSKTDSEGIDDRVYTEQYRRLPRDSRNEVGQRRTWERDWATHSPAEQNNEQRNRHYDDRNTHHNENSDSYYDDERGGYYRNKRNSHHDDQRENTKEDDLERESPKAKVYHDNRFGRDQHRFYYEQVFVLVEHWSGCVGQSVCDGLQQAICDHYGDQVDFATDTGQLGSFEVYINGKLLYSRMKNGGYPFENDVILAIDNVRNGRNFSELRHGVSRICVIL